MEIYRMIGIGFGPAGVALAAAFDDSFDAQPALQRDRLMFLESRSQPGWQKGLLFRNTDIQHHYLRDLATPRDPRSRFTFANFLKQHDRLFEFGSLVYGGGGGAVSRIEWSQYVAWAAGLLDSYVKYDHAVKHVECIEWKTQKLFAITTDHGRFVTRSIALCAGQEKYIPEVFRGIRSERMFHATDFLDAIERIPRHKLSRISVVGAGQAAIEVTQYLHNTFPDAILYCVQRSVGFQHGNHSPFVQRMFYPGESDEHFNLSPQAREQILREVRRANYAAVDREAISGLYRSLYEDDLLGQRRVHMVSGVEITEATMQGDDAFVLHTVNRFTGERTEFESDIIVLATGFNQTKVHPILRSIEDIIEFDELGHPSANYDFLLRTKLDSAPLIYIPGAAEYSHGLGSSNSFSMLALKAERVAHSAIRAGLFNPDSLSVPDRGDHEQRLHHSSIG